jgi:hypothetical protein
MYNLNTRVNNFKHKSIVDNNNLKMRKYKTASAAMTGDSSGTPAESEAISSRLDTANTSLSASGRLRIFFSLAS